MMSFSLNPFPVLETERLILRQPAMSDVDEIFKYRGNREFMRFIPHRYATGRSEVEEMISRVTDMISKAEGMHWAITAKGDDTILGTIGYVRFLKEHYRAEIGYSLHTPHQGKGIVHEAMKAAIDYGFNILGLHSIEAVVNSENLPSQKVLERYGFSKDAFFRDYLHHGGKFVDAYVYSLLKQ
jgi:[ribosomal protein S5]-alanine N-acetyltransferase